MDGAAREGDDVDHFEGCGKSMNDMPVGEHSACDVLCPQYSKLFLSTYLAAAALDMSSCDPEHSHPSTYS